MYYKVYYFNFYCGLTSYKLNIQTYSFHIKRLPYFDHKEILGGGGFGDENASSPRAFHILFDGLTNQLLGNKSHDG